MKSEFKKSEDTSNADWLDVALKSIRSSRVTVIGDYCLDGYWMLDEENSELSLETGLATRHVKTQCYTPGGAGNVAANLVALGVAEVRAIGLVGEDMFAGKLRGLLDDLGVDTSGLLVAPLPWQTALYAKPFCKGDEMSRLDFGVANSISDDCLSSLLDVLEKAVSCSDAVVINQQVSESIFSPHSISRINEIIARHPEVTFLVDARQYATEFKGAILKVNSYEAARMTGQEKSLNDVITPAEARIFATELTALTQKPVFVTRGEYGMVLAEGSRISDIPGIQILGKTDPVGAGDTVVSALAAAAGGGVDLEQAAHLANLAAAITVGKLRVTGAASAAELREAGALPDYIYEPELAESPRHARYAGETDIEVVREFPAPTIRHAIFDHDGTLSTLRHGWEQIMEPVMMQAVLGRHGSNVSEEIYRNVEEDVRTFIDRTTGIQTLAQMSGLIALVREYGFVPEAEILDEHGYKAIYNEALLEMVHARIRRIERGELSAEDFEIKGARAMLDTFHAAGVKLYLASGTDEADVKAEAEIMGYAHLFEGRIHGAVGDLKVEAKRVVLERIFVDGELSGSEVVVVGDGPVELREGKKRGALCLGVASNELCRFGLDETKRTRVIRAGADYVVPDFSQLEALKPVLGL